MAYDYSKRMLVKHKDTIDQLKELLTEGSVREIAFSNADDLRLARTLINNLLACLVIYEPQWAEPRKLLRTWAHYGNGLHGTPADEQWHLYVGIPDGRGMPGLDHAVAGAPPGSRSMATKLVQVEPQEVSGILQYPHEIRDQAALMKFIGWQQDHADNPHVDGLKVETREAAKAAPVLTNFCPAWIVEVIGETTLLFRRKPNEQP